MVWQVLLEKHLKENGVELLYGNTVCNAVLKKGKIIKISGGRYTSYTWNREDE